MKNLIYLSFVIVVISGCKGNSFTTKRYTKFGHASHKAKQTEKTIAKKDVSISSENDIETETVKNVEEELVLASSNSSSIKENILSRIPVQIFPTGLNLTKSEVLGADDSKQVYKSKKTSQKKKQAAKRIIGTVLKIVLWVVVLAVVVGVLLIIGAVA